MMVMVMVMVMMMDDDDVGAFLKLEPLGTNGLWQA